MIHFLKKNWTNISQIKNVNYYEITQIVFIVGKKLHETNFII